MTLTISGIQFHIKGKPLQAPKSSVVLSYIKAVKEGKQSAQKFLKTSKKR